MYCRYEVEDVLLSSISQVSATATQNPNNLKEHIFTLNDNTKLIVDTEALRFDVYHKNEVIMSANARGLFYFEHIRNREDAIEIPGIDMSNAWEESFGGDNDVRKNGIIPLWQ